MEHRTVSTRLSADIVDYLLANDFSLTELAGLIGVTKSFLSRVRSRQRSFTVDHLVALESVLGKPLPLLLLEATPRSTLSQGLAPLYDATVSAMRSSIAPAKARSTSKRKRG